MTTVQLSLALADTGSPSEPDNDARVRCLYSSLPLAPLRRYIRILRIKEPPEGNPDGPVGAELRVIDLDDSPKFAVLSYVWGHDGTQRIRCGDTYVQITNNGHAALVALRKQLGSYDIWVDAICIDQNNIEEKQYQIPLMGDIYAQASTAYIWLGDETQSSVKVMQYFRRTGLLEYTPSLDAPAKTIPRWKVCAALWALYSPFRKPVRDPLPVIDEHYSIPLSLRMRRLFRDPADRVTLKDIKLFLDRPWIRRVWTFQELVLSTNPIVVCGQEHIAWKRLCLSIVFVSEIASYGRTDLDPLLDVLSIWTRLIHTKISHDEEQHASVEYSASERAALEAHGIIRLGNYRDFMSRLMKYHMVAVTMFSLLMLWTCFICLGISIALLVLKLQFHRLENWPIAVPIILLPIGIFAVFFLFLGIHIMPPLLVGHGHSVTTEEHRKHEVKTGEWVDAILTRSAFKPHDKAFGMHAILQRLLHRQLPAPDYEKPLSYIYRELCLQIMNYTTSFYHLLPASLDQQEGQPSWVVDWSIPLSRTWRGIAYRRDDELAIWTIVPDKPNELLTEASCKGTIDVLYIMKTVLSSGLEVATNTKMANLKTMLDFAKLFPSYQQLNSFMRYMLERTDATGNHPERISYWAEAIYHIRHKPVTYAYKRYQRFYFWDIYSTVQATFNLAHEFYTGFLDRTETICLHLSSRNIALFHANVKGQLPFVGFCTTNARVGDAVVHFVGGPCDFVIRGPWTAARLVSPATLMECDPIDSLYKSFKGGTIRISPHDKVKSKPITLC